MKKLLSIFFALAFILSFVRHFRPPLKTRIHLGQRCKAPAPPFPRRAAGVLQTFTTFCPAALDGGAKATL